jgi:hypothetical protein
MLQLRPEYYPPVAVGKENCGVKEGKLEVMSIKSII